MVTPNAHPYAVDGELGRFTFRTHTLACESGQTWSTAAEVFAALGPREWYRTAGLRELLLQTVTHMAYRPAVALLNRIRHEAADSGTPVRTAAEVVEREGRTMQTAFDQWATRVFADGGFTPEGQPATAAPPPAADSVIRLPQTTVDQAVTHYNHDKAEAFRIDAAAATACYEDPNHTINVSIDDVGVKKQKASGRAPNTPAKDRREYVHNTIAHVESPRGRYVLNGLGTEAVLRLLIAFLLHHQMLSDYSVQFFVDGARTLHAAILHRLAGWLPLRILLDWYHLEEKCKVELSLALRGSKIRNAILDELLPLLWLGRVDAAIADLRAIPDHQLKPGQSIDKLVGYFERNRAYIPCYALRKALHLRNSSNRGEKANDLCVAGRQKHQGMSWSCSGSVALATVTTRNHNQGLTAWCTDQELTFDWVA